VRIPRLAEVLEALPGVRLNVELKPDARDAAERLAAVVRESHAEDCLCLGSEHEDAARHLAEVLPDACLFFPGRSLVGAVLYLRGMIPDRPTGPWTVLDMPLYYGDDRLVDPGFLERAASLGLWVNCWTIDEPPEMRRLVAEGVGGIMTDRPDLLRAVLDDE
jgi:glycerophosphoryl diester phosphodiesterase